MEQHAELASPDERNPARITVSNRPVQLHRNSTDAIVGAPINAVTTPCKSARRVEMDLDVINGVRSVCFQLQDVHTIPFNYRVASGHAWKYLLQSHEHERRQGIYRVSLLWSPVILMLVLTLIPLRLCQ